MRSLRRADSRAHLRRRVEGLRPDSRPRWGHFTAPQMLAHLTESLRMAMGELAVAPRPARPILRHAPFKQLAVYLLPIPKGIPTSPELLLRAAGMTGEMWAAEQAEFAAALERFGGRPEDHAWPAHPTFGPLSGSAWGVLQYRHLDHHCRQFGV